MELPNSRSDVKLKKCVVIETSDKDNSLVRIKDLNVS